MKKKIILIVIGLLALLALSAFVAFRVQAVKNSAKSAASDISGFIFFYGDGCPHCIRVEQFMADNKIEEKMTIAKKEVSKNPDNLSLLASINEKCGLSTVVLSWPVLWDGTAGKCYSGDVDIIKYFQDRFGL